MSVTINTIKSNLKILKVKNHQLKEEVIAYEVKKTSDSDLYTKNIENLLKVDTNKYFETINTDIRLVVDEILGDNFNVFDIIPKTRINEESKTKIGAEKATAKEVVTKAAAKAAKAAGAAEAAAKAAKAAKAATKAAAKAATKAAAKAAAKAAVKAELEKKAAEAAEAAKAAGAAEAAAETAETAKAAKAAKAAAKAELEKKAAEAAEAAVKAELEKKAAEAEEAEEAAAEAEAKAKVAAEAAEAAEAEAEAKAKVAAEFKEAEYSIINNILEEIIQKIEDILIDLIPTRSSDDSIKNRNYKIRNYSKNNKKSAKITYLVYINPFLFILSLVLLLLHLFAKTENYIFHSKWWLSFLIPLIFSTICFFYDLFNKNISSKSSIRRVLRKIDKEYSLLVEEKEIEHKEYRYGHKQYYLTDQINIIKAITWGYLNPNAFVTKSNKYMTRGEDELFLNRNSIFTDYKEDQDEKEFGYLLYKPGINPITKEGFEYMPQKSVFSQILSSRPFTMITILASLITFYVAVRNDIIGLSEITIANFPESYNISDLPIDINIKNPSLNIYDSLVREIDLTVLKTTYDSNFNDLFSVMFIHNSNIVKKIWDKKESTSNGKLSLKVNTKLDQLKNKTLTVSKFICPYLLTNESHVTILDKLADSNPVGTALNTITIGSDEYTNQLDEYIVNTVVYYHLLDSIQ